VNTAWATLAALRRLKRASDVARLRGKELADLVPKSVVELTISAEQHDAESGVAPVVADQDVEQTPVVETAAPAEAEQEAANASA